MVEQSFAQLPKTIMERSNEITSTCKIL